MPTPTYVAIAKTVLTGSQTTITFSSIPSTYTDLVILFTSRNTVTNNGFVNINFNGSTTSFTNTYLEGTGSMSASGRNFDRLSGTSVKSNYTTNTFSSNEIYIPNYAGSTNKVYSATFAEENNATAAEMMAVAGLWSNTAAITQIDLVGMAGDFVSGSRFDLYGIKNS